MKRFTLGIVGLVALSSLGSLSACDSGSEYESQFKTDSLGADDTWPTLFGRTISGGGTAEGFDVFELDIEGDYYNVQTNPWGGAEQTITAGGENIFSVDNIVTGVREGWEVAAFPSVYKGVDQGGNVSKDSGMPIAISDIDYVHTGLKTNTTSIQFSGNTTYDVYFTESQHLTGGPPDVFLMVWFDAHKFNPINGEGEGYACGDQPPTFVESCSKHGTIKIHNVVFHRFYGWNGHAWVVSYVPTVPFDTWEFNLKHFIDDSVSLGFLNDQMYLQSIQAGFEMSSPGTGLTIEDFYIDIEGTSADGVSGGNGGAGGAN